MKKLYQKSELGFSLLWIGLYVLVMNIALQVCGGFDNLESKTVAQVLVPVLCIVVLAMGTTVWILKNGLSQKYGLCKFRGNLRSFLWFLPLVLMSCINLKNGLALTAHPAVAVLMAVNLAVGGYVEEIIFRGFLFRSMGRDNLRSAIIVSAVTFGAGHIVNLLNTANIWSVLLQVCYAISIGFLYTVIVYKGGSLLPCILSHIFVNFTSVFASTEGPFTRLATAIFGQATQNLTELSAAAVIILISGSYAIYVWKKK